MFWGDIIIEYPERIQDLPKDLVCLNWYYWEQYEEEKVKIISDNGFNQLYLVMKKYLLSEKVLVKVMEPAVLAEQLE